MSNIGGTISGTAPDRKPGLARTGPGGRRPFPSRGRKRPGGWRSTRGGRAVRPGRAMRSGGSAMSASRSTAIAEHGVKAPWCEVPLSAIAAVSWALVEVPGRPRSGRGSWLRTRRARRADDRDGRGTRGGRVGDALGLVSAFGLEGAEARGAIEITPLGMCLAGALLLPLFFLSSSCGPCGGGSWGGARRTPRPSGGGGCPPRRDDRSVSLGGAERRHPRRGCVRGGCRRAGVGGLVPNRFGVLVGTRAAVGFTADTTPTLVGELGWSAKCRRSPCRPSGVRRCPGLGRCAQGWCGRPCRPWSRWRCRRWQGSRGGAGGRLG